MITYINFAVIVAQNIILIANSSSKDEYFISLSLDQPFVWLQIISTIIAGLIMVAYCIKDVHLLVKNINLVLKIRAQSYGSNYNNYNPLIKLGIKLSMIMLDPTFAYHFIYTFIVGLVFYNKLFAALLLLDIFFQIPTLSNFSFYFREPAHVNLETQNLTNFSHCFVYSGAVLLQYFHVLQLQKANSGLL